MIQKWLLPCNVRIYDVVDHFTKSDTLFWGVSSATNVGDEVYIYVGKPYSEILFRCHIEELNVSKDVVNASAVSFLTTKKLRKNYAKIQLDTSFPENRFPYSELIKHGLVSVQSQMRVPTELVNYLELKG